MPVLIPPPPPQTAAICPFDEAEELAIAQGREGRQVRDQVEMVGRHWRQRSLDTVGEPGADLLDELNAYRHVPFERVGTRRVRYVRTRDLQPRKIDIDEDE